ncbi:MAG TPA: glycosyltransferase family 1 protein [Chthonomonadaceae bacterium]|nr:glycosyltransferase family 1 protein [Chthonomonadaceae bacterium]
MRIAIDGRALTGRFTGDRTYWRNLLRALPGVDAANEYLIYSRTLVPEGELPEASNFRCRLVDAPNDRLWTLLALPRALGRDSADLVHVQYTAPPRVLCPCPIVTTVHDISFRLYPQWFPARHRALLNLTVPASMRQAARVITDSESSRQDILRIYGLPPERVVAILLGLPEEFVAIARRGPEVWEQETARQIAKERFGLERPFVLAVGVLQPRKNLRLLAEAFGQARAAHRLPHQLVLVGKAGWDTEREVLRQAAACGGGAEAAEAVVFTGYVEDADLPILYRACAAFAYPSLYEGFGIPPLEAMACAAPVLVADAPAMPEVVGEAALIVPATDVAAWADALARVLQDADLRHDLSLRGPRHAARFTWEATAARTVAVYQEAVTRAH